MSNRLTALAFKEASLDSPSFRTSVNHYHTQALGLENWIQENTNLSKKRPISVLSEMRREEDSIIERLLPPLPYLSNGLVENQENTPKMVHEMQDALKTFSSTISALMYGNPETYLTTYLDILVKVVKPYKEVRENFDYYQGRFDAVNRNYHEIKISSFSKPSVIQEKAVELFDIRKLYLEASIDLLWSIAKIQIKLDGLIARMIELTIPSASQSKNGPYRINISPELELQLTRYIGWTNELSKCLEDSTEDYQKAKSYMIEYCQKHLAPSDDLSTYDVSSIDTKSLIASEPPFELKKSGWLFIRTKVRATGRWTWLRRWCVLEKGMFGMLMASPSKTYVEESDKFGILLITCNYNAQEDRRYCFDINIVNKTDSGEADDLTLTFQAEKLSELSEWLSAFTYAKKRAMTIDKTSPEYSVLISRVSPSFIEFACSSTTDVDIQTTSVTEQKTHSLVQLIQANPNNLGDYGVFKDPSFRFPIMTQVTKHAVIANAFIVDQGIPNAITANLWGAAQLHHSSHSKTLNRVSDNVPRNAWNPIVYPDFYPERMKSDNLLFRSLFSNLLQSTNSKDDLLLFKELCIFSVADGKRHPCTIFVTAQNIYIFSDFLGFVFLQICRFHDLLGCSVVDNETPGHNGKISLEIKGHSQPAVTLEAFYCDPQTLCEKILLILEANLKGDSFHIDRLLNCLEGIEKNAHQKSSETSAPLSTELSLIRALNIDKMHLRQRQQQFQLNYDTIFRVDFAVPSRALVHLMFGDKSSVFHEFNFLSRSRTKHDSVTPWFVNPETKEIVRKLRFRLKLGKTVVTTNKLQEPAVIEFNHMDIVQTIRKISKNFYYEIDQRTGYFSIPLAKHFFIETKYIIINHVKDDYSKNSTKIPSSACSLYTYYNIVFVNKTTRKPAKSISYIDRFVRTSFLSILKNESRSVKHILGTYVAKLGKHSHVVKAIRIGGQIGVAEGAAPPDPEYFANSVSDQVVYTKRLMIRLTMRWSFIFWSRLFINGIKFFFGMFYALLTNLMMLNRLVLGILLVSVLTNFYLTYRATVDFWAFKKAEKFADSILNMKSVKMERSLAIADISVLTKELVTQNDALERYVEENPAESSQIKDARNEMALRRNQILIELGMLNSIEKDLIVTEYKNFLLKELEMCNTAHREYNSFMKNHTQLEQYCKSCQKQLQYLNDLL